MKRSFGSTDFKDGHLFDATLDELYRREDDDAEETAVGERPKPGGDEQRESEADVHPE